MTLLEAGVYIKDWLAAVWQVFEVEIFPGLSFGSIAIGLFFVNIAILIFRKFFELNNEEGHK